MQNNNVIKNKHTGIQQSTTEEPFVWTDANTKLFLHLYKDAITHQKIRIKKYCGGNCRKPCSHITIMLLQHKWRINLNLLKDHIKP